MAKTVVTLTDPLSTLVTKVNQISNDLGDIQNMHLYDSSVAGILIKVDSDANATSTASVRSVLSTGTPQNLIYDSSGGQFSLLFDSAQARKAISVSSSGSGSLAYNNSTGVLTYAGPGASDVVNDTTPQLGGDLDANSKRIKLGDHTVNADLSLGNKIVLGADSDLKLYHDGTNSYVQSLASPLILKGGAVRMHSSAGADMLSASTGGTIKFYFNGAKRIETTNAGVTVTGTTTSTGNFIGNLTGDASGSSGTCTGNAATASALASAVNIGGVSFNGSSSIDLPGVNTGGNQNTSGIAAEATILENTRTIALTGDVAGSVTFNGSSNVSMSTTIQANSVALATDTTGDFVYRIAAGTGVGVSATSGEGSHPSISIGQAVGTGNHVQFHCLGLGTGASGVNGELRAAGNITAYYSSDERLKENIVNIPNALDKVTNINGVKFDWTADYMKDHGGEDDLFNRKHQVGVIAQEVEKVLPEVVVDREDGYKAVRYEQMVPLLIEAIKELNQKVKDLENK
tara:strand:+ start:693 stop:2237 length:1545 start_codon:yes stop_codon:yes gene_type:complete